MGKYDSVNNNIDLMYEAEVDEDSFFRHCKDETRRLSSSSGVSSGSPQKASHGKPQTLISSTSGQGEAQISSIGSSDQRRAQFSSGGSSNSPDPVQLCQSSVSATVGCFDKVPASGTTLSAALLKSQSRQPTTAKGLQLQ